MLRPRLLLVDLALVTLATLATVLVRDNFEFVPEHFRSMPIYLGATLIAATVAFALTGASRTVWRFSSLADYINLVAAVAVTVTAAVAFMFYYNRLDGISRSTPILQALLMVILLVSARVFMRLRHQSRAKPVQLASVVPMAARLNYLVAGYSKTTEFYLRAVSEIAADRIQIVGVLGHSATKSGRIFHGIPVVGVLTAVAKCLQDLSVHGVFVDRICVTTPQHLLSPDELEQLRAVEAAGSVGVFFLEDLMIDEAGSFGRRVPDQPASLEAASNLAFQLTDDRLAALSRRPYWRLKRTFDAVLSATLLIMLAPATVLAALLVAIDVGRPLAFWQQRPGLMGHPFRLYKLRTLSAAHSKTGERLTDAERSSMIGRFLRRTRLDELPQLYNILVGEMSFIGPRPLLPVDQSPAYAARMLVRPGLTGWAQVNGGRYVSAADKAALDVWYVENASFAIDAQIFLRTLGVVVFGERVDHGLIQRTWEQLMAAGICLSARPESLGWATMTDNGAQGGGVVPAQRAA